MANIFGKTLKIRVKNCSLLSSDPNGNWKMYGVNFTHEGVDYEAITFNQNVISGKTYIFDITESKKKPGNIVLKKVEDVDTGQVKNGEKVSLTLPRKVDMPLILEQLMKVNTEVDALGKTQKNKVQGYFFRGIEDMTNHLHGLFSKYGILILTKIHEDRSELVTMKSKNGPRDIFHIQAIYEFTFIAADGSQVSTQGKAEGIDSGDKASAKGASMALKNALATMFLIPTKDMPDPDKDVSIVFESEGSQYDQGKIISEIINANMDGLKEIKSKYPGIENDEEVMKAFESRLSDLQE